MKKKSVKPVVTAVDPAPEQSSEPEPEEKTEEPQEEVKESSWVGVTDEMGGLYLSKEDFLSWANRRLRIQVCDSEAKRMRAEADFTMMKASLQVTKLRDTATGFEKRSKIHAEEQGDFITVLSKKYDLDFKNPNVTLDDESGKIVLIDPEKGLPKLSQ